MTGWWLSAAVLVLDVISLMDIFTGDRAPRNKLLWIVLILLLPLAGPLLYYLLARGEGRPGGFDR